jgi:hypothetical protein
MLNIDCIHLPDHESSEPVFILDDFGLLGDSASPKHSNPDPIAWRRLRREANLAVGRDNEAERQRQQQGRLLQARGPASA